MGDYYIEAFYGMGMCSAGVMGGFMGMPWSEITAYSVGHDLITDHRDRQVLFDMSRTYVRELGLGTNPLSISPMDRAG